MTRVVQVPASKLDGDVAPSSRPAPASPVDTPRDPRRLYTRALELATAKINHRAPPGELEGLPDRWAWDLPKDVCRGRLRAAYVRVTVGGESAGPENRWRAKAGKPSWVPVGVVCDGCDAYWPKPRG